MVCLFQGSGAAVTYEAARVQDALQPVFRVLSQGLVEQTRPAPHNHSQAHHQTRRQSSNSTRLLAVHERTSLLEGHRDRAVWSSERRGARSRCHVRDQWCISNAVGKQTGAAIPAPRADTAAYSRGHPDKVN
jgi:hypothetical protein